MQANGLPDCFFFFLFCLIDIFRQVARNRLYGNKLRHLKRLMKKLIVKKKNVGPAKGGCIYIM